MAKRHGYVVGGSNWVSDSAYAKKLAKRWADETNRAVEVRPVDERGAAGRVIYTARPAKRNPRRNNWKAGKWIRAEAVRLRKVAGRFVMDVKKAI